MNKIFYVVSMSLTVLVSMQVMASENVVKNSEFTDERLGVLAERYGEKSVSGYEYMTDSEMDQHIDTVFMLVVREDDLKELDAKYQSESKEIHAMLNE